MKKMRNKGKVHPFTTSSSSNNNNVVDDSSTPNKDAFFMLTLLPAAILALVSALTLDDREVIAYMIARSVNYNTVSPSLFPADGDKKKIAPSKKQQQQQQSFDCGAHSHGHTSSPALFDCECFHCYTRFWLRWDSSPNRELIHHAIEAFEEKQQCSLNNGGEMSSKKGANGRSKRKDKTGSRKSGKISSHGSGGGGVLEFPVKENQGNGILELPERDVAAEVGDVAAPENELVAAPVVAEQRSHRGLVRKVLPDVVGLLNSRLWRLWSPNV